MATTPIARAEVTEPVEPIQYRRPIFYYIMKVLNFMVLAAIGLVVISPFVLAFLGTFKTDAEIIAWPPTFLPSEWHLENWAKLWNTDFGGLPQSLGTTSLGFIAGLLVFLLVFLATSLRGEKRQGRLPVWAGLGGTVLLTVATSAGLAIYLLRSFSERPAMGISVPIATELVMLLVIVLVALSRPAWERVLLSAGLSILAGLGVGWLVHQAAWAAGGGRFIRWLVNITVLSVVFASLQLVFCAMAAYALARLRFPGRNFIFGFMLLSMMIPGTVTLIPAYVLITKLGWANTAYSLILPSLTSAFGIFMLTQFLKTIPRELEEAAFIDGASYFQIFKDIVLPLARPALLTLFILQFQSMWNNFMTPLLYLNTADMWVLNVALSTFQQQYKAQWNITLVGAMINAFPILLMFFFFSKYYIEGVGRSGLKE